MTEINAMAAPAPVPAISLDKGPVVVAGLAFALGAAAIAEAIDLRQAALFLIGGLLAVPDFRANAGDAVWTYLALLKAANHRGVVCKRSDQIAAMLQSEVVPWPT